MWECITHPLPPGTLYIAREILLGSFSKSTQRPRRPHPTPLSFSLPTLAPSRSPQILLPTPRTSLAKSIYLSCSLRCGLLPTPHGHSLPYPVLRYPAVPAFEIDICFSSRTTNRRIPYHSPSLLLRPLAKLYFINRPPRVDHTAPRACLSDSFVFGQIESDLQSPDETHNTISLGQTSQRQEPDKCLTRFAPYSFTSTLHP